MCSALSILNGGPLILSARFVRRGMSPAAWLDILLKQPGAFDFVLIILSCGKKDLPFPLWVL